MNPTKLKPCDVTKSFVIDDKGNDILIIKGMPIEDTAKFRAELMKRYNDYNLLKVYVVGLFLTVITLVIALCV